MLRPHQIEPAAQLVEMLRAGQVAMDLSDTGVGKTYVAAAVASQLALPTLCVVPKISISAWHTAAQSFGDNVSVIGYEALRTGKTPFGRWEKQPGPAQIYYQCTHCQRKYKFAETIDACYCHPAGIHCFETKKVPRSYGRWHFHSAVQLVIFDEIHRCSALDSLNAEMLIGAKRDGQRILGLSATLGNSPLQMRASGYALGLHGLANFHQWAARYGCRRIPGAGFKWLVSAARQLEIMAEIRAAIIPSRGVRVTHESIPDFPGCDISAELYDLDTNGQIDSLYSEMAKALEQLHKRGELDKCSEHPLTMILRARQKIELLKVPVMCELAADYKAKGFSVAMFINFAQTMEELRKRLSTDCIVDGSMEGAKYRDANIRRFQKNEVSEILVNIKAGGVHLSLHDVDGNHPRVGLAMPTDSATAVRQLLGRLPRHGGRSRSFYRFLFAAGTVEVGMHRALVGKLNNLDALLDSDLHPENLKFV